jgi:hypothetical protein
VFASLVTIKGLRETANSYTHDLNGGRYLLPVLLAWFATLMILFFAELPLSASFSSNPKVKPSLAPQPQPDFAPAGRHRKNKTGRQQRLN